MKNVCIMALFVALVLGCVYTAYLLVLADHPWFALLILMGAFSVHVTHGGSGHA